MFEGSLAHECAARNDIAGLENLFKKGKCKSFMEVIPSSGSTLLHTAATEGHFDMVYYLLCKGADVGARDKQNWTPLHCASCSLHLKVATLLLTRGADPNAVNDQSTTSLHYIIRGPYSEELLEVLDLLIEKGASLECRNKYNETPLMHASAKGMTESVRFLVDHHANVNALNAHGQTVLHHAIMGGNRDTTLLLLKNGATASLNSKAEEIGTPLELANKEGKEELSDLLANFSNYSKESTYGGFQGGKSNLEMFIREENKKFVSDMSDDKSASSLPSEEDIHSPLMKSPTMNRVGSAIEPEFVNEENLDKNWFYGANISRVAAEKLLASCPMDKQVFLIRKRTQHGTYVLSKRQEPLKFSHILIRTYNPKSKTNLNAAQISVENHVGLYFENSNDTSVYRTFEDLVQFSEETKGLKAVGLYATISGRSAVSDASELALSILRTKFSASSIERRSLSASEWGSIEETRALERNVLPHPEFSIEIGSNDPSTVRTISKQPYHYKNWFYHSDHHNYIGMMPRKGKSGRWEPILVSVIPFENPPDKIRLIVWSRLGDRACFFQFPAASKVSSAKAIKWKNGLPQEVLNFVKEQVQEQRKSKEPDLVIHLEYIKNYEDVKDQLFEFEALDPMRPKCFSVGVVFAKQGQTDEKEIFNNEHGSPAFEEFLDFLGDRITLQGWRGYRGDLDTKTNSVGIHSLYRRWKGLEIMFHVSTMLPYMTGGEQEQQIARKRRIGNDLGVIVFQEGGTYQPPIASQLLHSYFIVSPMNTDKVEALEVHYKLGCTTRVGVPEFGPQLPLPAVFPRGHDFLDFLMTKVVNGLLGARSAPGVRERIWCNPKEAFLNELVKKHAKSKTIVQLCKETKE
eukprot:TRINITY_DN3818_c0_g1_i1.p1 TRINITY_DN3818_c0_g1~~TRINITY_DN3818_c0_g1_i1.p1  ORF type:complete len:860 (-),score=351.26 TRINITY_DN3818_c0_g1_i1:43-2622(-)